MADDKLNVITICGSLRKGSYNASLARTLPSLAPAGMSITPAPAWDKMPIYNHDIQADTGFPADAEAWAAAIRSADGVIIVSPEYNWSIPGGLKNAIDWVSRMKDVPFKDKPVAIQSCAGGILGGARMQYHLRQSLLSIDAFLFGKPEILVTFAAKKFDEKTLELTDQPTIDIVKQQLAGFEKFIRRLNGKEIAMARLDGRVALLTGGAKGIGRHYAHRLAAEGSRLMIADIADGKELAEEIAGKHGANSVASAVADVSDESAVKALVAKTMERFGKIDILVNNAALFAPLAEQKVTEIDVELWDRVMSINIRGVFLMTKHVAPHMIAQKYGKIINISSGTVARGIPNFAHYVTSKGAVTAFTRSVSRELGEHNICVNNLAPGFTLSDSVINENPGHLAHSQAPSLARRALKRDEYPEDLLGALVFLASADSDFVTGQTIAVDGGATNN